MGSPAAPGRAALALAAGLALSGCAASSADPGELAADPGDGLRVAASFYPLQWVSEQVAGDAAAVEGLTPPGAEPHDLELGPRQVAGIGEADLVVYLAGFQPAVDEAVEQEAADSALDVTRAAQLHPAASGVAEEGEHAEEGENDRAATDPHFWLDPTRLADVADAVAARLGEIDPDDAGGYAGRAREVRERLEALDVELREGLAGCAGTRLVTSHTAFGYLAERYGMEQVGISGLSPDAEPSPRDLAEVARFVRKNGVRTIYSETLVSPDVAETIARETGAGTAVLDPIEGLTDASAGEDYLAVMRGNMATLKEGQPCR